MSERTKPPTQKEIARLAGVSQVTVNAVLNGSSHTRTKPETRELILGIAKKLNYRVQRHASITRTGKSGAIAIIYASSLVEVGHLRFNITTGAVREAGFFPEVHDVTWFDNDFEKTWNAVLQNRPEGILLVGGTAKMTPKARALIAESNIPIVSISGPSLPDIPLIIPDYEDSFRRLTGHLVETGRKNIALIMRKPAMYQKAYRWQDERRLGYLRGAKEFGFEPVLYDLDFKRPEGRGASIAFSEAHVADYFAHGYEFAKNAIAENLKADAWMFFNDALAMGALRALGESGIAVPKGMAVTGCDGQVSAQYGYIPVTTLVQPIWLVVAEGVELLIKMIRKSTPSGNLIRRLPCGLRFGAST